MSAGISGGMPRSFAYTLDENGRIIRRGQSGGVASCMGLWRRLDWFRLPDRRYGPSQPLESAKFKKLQKVG